MDTMDCFNDPDSEGELLLFSSGVEGSGLTVVGGSHMTLCERFWTPGDKIHVTGVGLVSVKRG